VGPGGEELVVLDKAVELDEGVGVAVVVDVARVELVILLLLLEEKLELTTFVEVDILYILMRLPAPQYSLLLPLHV
jgi:hypothetical protein